MSPITHFEWQVWINTNDLTITKKYDFFYDKKKTTFSKYMPTILIHQKKQIKSHKLLVDGFIRAKIQNDEPDEHGENHREP